MIGHACFRLVREPGNGSGGHLWWVECKTCPWRGDLHRHPIYAARDSMEHTRETAKAAVKA